jgi:hypothetical protein
MLSVGMKRLYKDEYISICMDEEERLLYYKIVGYPKFSEVIRDGHDRLYEIALEMKRGHRVVNLVADLLEAKILLTRDIKFIGSVSYPRLAKTGIKNLVILVPDDIHVQINVQKTIECMGSNVFQYKPCGSMEEAREWFRIL